MKTNWKNAPLLQKVVTIISILASLSVVVLAVLQIFDIWEQAINIYMPLMGVTMLCQSYTQWNNSRKVAYFSIGTAAFIFICSIVVFFVKQPKALVPLRSEGFLQLYKIFFKNLLTIPFDCDIIQYSIFTQAYFPIISIATQIEFYTTE